MNPESPYLSVVVPVYNETKRLNGITTIADYLSKQAFTSELILVDDGSSDDTLQKLRDLQQTLPAQIKTEIVTYQPNRGKGYAIKQGILTARGSYRLFTDVDLSTPITEFDHFLPVLAQFGIVIASRRREKTAILVHQTMLRESLGRGFTLLSQIMLQMPLSDFTCGFKCFSAAAASAIFPIAQIDRWGFDCETLYIGHTLGFNIKEISVHWTNDPQTRVRLPQDIFRSLSDLIRIRRNGVKRS